MKLMLFAKTGKSKKRGEKQMKYTFLLISGIMFGISLGIFLNILKIHGFEFFKKNKNHK